MDTRILAGRMLAGPIERIENDDGTVTYRSIKILEAGKWTDSASEETIHYSEEGISNLEITDDNTVNLFHDIDNEVSDIGHMEPDSAEAEDGALFADITLHLDNSASEYADENLQATLENAGAVGFGGPSVEIPADGQELEYDDSEGLYELKNGRIDGLGLVSNPASKTVAFDQQAAERSVALSSGEESKVMHLQTASMDIATIRDRFELSDDLDDDTIKALAEAGAIQLEEDDDEDEEEEEDVENEEDEDKEKEEADDEDDEEEDTEMQDTEELAERIETLEGMVGDIRSDLEELMNAAAEASELEDFKDDLEDAKQELADAETVEEIDKRLSNLEDEPDKSSMALSDDDDTDDWINATTTFDGKTGL